jgi:starch phosphorylase
VAGSTAEICDEVGDDNVFIFGTRAGAVARVREQQRMGGHAPDARFANAAARIRAGDFGDAAGYETLLASLDSARDHYLLGADFGSYLEAQARVDRCYRTQEEWTRMSIECCAGMARFSSDETIRKYAREIWAVDPIAL